MTEIQTFKVDIDTPFGYLEGVPVEFHVDVDRFPAEPHSWGLSRGNDCEVSARFHRMHLGELSLRHNEVFAAFGPENVNRWEQEVAARIFEGE